MDSDTRIIIPIELMKILEEFSSGFDPINKLFNENFL